VISGPYYRLHCDGSQCPQVEDFEVGKPPLETLVYLARLAGWTVETVSNFDRDLCPKCTQLEVDR
jgi:hypothetical protein